MKLKKILFKNRNLYTMLIIDEDREVSSGQLVNVITRTSKEALDEKASFYEEELIPREFNWD